MSVKLSLTIEIDQDLLKNNNDASKLLRLIACDVEQGKAGGYIRNQHTGNESNRWEINVNRK